MLLAAALYAVGGFPYIVWGCEDGVGVSHHMVCELCIACVGIAEVEHGRLVSEQLVGGIAGIWGRVAQQPPRIRILSSAWPGMVAVGPDMVGDPGVRSRGSGHESEATEEGSHGEAGILADIINCVLERDERDVSGFSRVRARGWREAV
uniref:Uncharacterized protein n=1 Tax=Physcomitrium patens TaxID=3218 RepID=A0A7I4BG55_PHYPA